MRNAAAGERLNVGNYDPCTIHIGGRNSERLMVAYVNEYGVFQPLERRNDGREWYLDSIADLGSKAEILVYIKDDQNGGFANDSYPLKVRIGGDEYNFPPPVQQLAAVIIGEFYVRGDSRRVKVSNEGYTFGIEAFARARNLAVKDIPGHSPPSTARETWGGGEPSPSQGGRPYAPGQSLGSGSGVLVAPGIIATNAHVVEHGQSFEIGGSREPLTLLDVDVAHDLAILRGRFDGEIIPMRSTAAIWLGEAVLAAGFPLQDLLGNDLKVSTGNISGLKGAEGDVARFQFTAPIGSGSSGGAIVDEAGNLVGLTSAALAHNNLRERGAISENVNFGIKVSLVHEMLAAAGIDVPQTVLRQDKDRRNVVQQLRRSVVSIMVKG